MAEAPQLNGWQYLILEVVKIAAQLITAALASGALYYGFHASDRAGLAIDQNNVTQKQVDDVDKRVKELQSRKPLVFKEADPQ